MKKLLFLLPAVAFGMASCSSDEFVEEQVQGQVDAAEVPSFSMRPAVNASTRAESWDNLNFSQFYLTTSGKFYNAGQLRATPDENHFDYSGLKADNTGTLAGGMQFQNTLVQKFNNVWYIDLNGNGAIPAEEQHKVFWPSKNAESNFVATNWIDAITDGFEKVRVGEYQVNPTTEGNVTNDGRHHATSYTTYHEGSSQYDYKVMSHEAMRDIVVANNPGGKASQFTNGVPLYFRHALSQIVFRAVNDSAPAAGNKGFKVKLAGLRLNNIYGAGDMAMPTTDTKDGLAADMWTNQNTYVDYKMLTGGDSKDSSMTGTEGQKTSNYIPSLVRELTSTIEDLTETFAPAHMLVPQNLGLVETDLAYSNKERKEGSSKGVTINKVPQGTGTYLSFLIQVIDDSKSEGTEAYYVYPKGKLDGTNWSMNEKGYAWACVDLDTNWEPGKKYIYTLHFSTTGIGKVDPNQEPEGIEQPNPGEEIIDYPVGLVLDVQVVDWTDESIDLVNPTVN